jgi:hypothetical protein
VGFADFRSMLEEKITFMECDRYWRLCKQVAEGKAQRFETFLNLLNPMSNYLI